MSIRLDKRVDGNEELANMVDRVTKEVAHRIKGEMVVEKVQHALADAQAAAGKL